MPSSKTLTFIPPLFFVLKYLLYTSAAHMQVHYRLFFCIEANTMNPDQPAPKELLFLVHIICNIDCLRTYGKERTGLTGGLRIVFSRIGSYERILCLTVPEDFHQVLRSYTQHGYRVLALAWKPLPNKYNYVKIQRINR